MSKVFANPFEYIDDRLNGIETLLIEIRRSVSPLPPEKDFTRIQAAEDLYISLKTLNTLLRTGQLEYYNIGRSVRIKKAAIDIFKENQKGSC